MGMSWFARKRGLSLGGSEYNMDLGEYVIIGRTTSAEAQAVSGTPRWWLEIVHVLILDHWGDVTKIMIVLWQHIGTVCTTVEAGRTDSGGYVRGDVAFVKCELVQSKGLSWACTSVEEILHRSLLNMSSLEQGRGVFGEFLVQREGTCRRNVRVFTGCSTIRVLMGKNSVPLEAGRGGRGDKRGRAWLRCLVLSGMRGGRVHQISGIDTSTRHRVLAIVIVQIGIGSGGKQSEVRKALVMWAAISPGSRSIGMEWKRGRMELR